MSISIDSSLHQTRRTFLGRTLSVTTVSLFGAPIACRSVRADDASAPLKIGSRRVTAQAPQAAFAAPVDTTSGFTVKFTVSLMGWMKGFVGFSTAIASLGAVYCTAGVIILIALKTSFAKDYYHESANAGIAPDSHADVRNAQGK